MSRSIGTAMFKYRSIILINGIENIFVSFFFFQSKNVSVWFIDAENSFSRKLLPLRGIEENVGKFKWLLCLYTLAKVHSFATNLIYCQFVGLLTIVSVTSESKAWNAIKRIKFQVLNIHTKYIRSKKNPITSESAFVASFSSHSIHLERV